jgi:hypothetical protein
MLGAAGILIQRRCTCNTERRVGWHWKTEEESGKPAAWAAAQTVNASGALNRGSQSEHCTHNADAAAADRIP